METEMKKHDQEAKELQQKELQAHSKSLQRGDKEKRAIYKKHMHIREGKLMPTGIQN